MTDGVRRDGASIIVSKASNILCVYSRGNGSSHSDWSSTLESIPQICLPEEPNVFIYIFDSLESLISVLDQLSKSFPKLLAYYYESLSPKIYKIEDLVLKGVEVVIMNPSETQCITDSLQWTSDSQTRLDLGDTDEVFNKLSLSPYNQCTVHRLSPNASSITPQIDSHSFDDPISLLFLDNPGKLSLISQDQIEARLIIQRNSLIHLRGAQRYLYKYGIASTDTTLVLILRKSLEAAVCQCPYEEICDSRQNATIRLNDEMASKLESLHVHSVYENIANHFSDTRHKPWPKVMDFLNSVDPNGTLIDVGCGNGKYFGHHPGMLQIGCDHSFGLLQIVQERNFEAVRCDCLQLPFRSNLADAIISIAVIHHLSTWERRRTALIEIIRVLKVGGRLLIYAWAKEQNKNSKASSYLKKNFSASNVDVKRCDTQFPLVLPVHKNRTNFLHNDLLVPWKKKQPSSEKSSGEEETFHRYYHMFQEGEIEELALSIDGLAIEEVYYEQGNWCLIARKT